MIHPDIWLVQTSTSRLFTTIGPDGEQYEHASGTIIADWDHADNGLLTKSPAVFEQLMAGGDRPSLVFEFASVDTTMLLAPNDRALLVAPEIAATVRTLTTQDFVHPATVNGDSGWLLVTAPQVPDPELRGSAYIKPTIVDGQVVDFQPSFDWRPPLASADRLGAGLFRVARMPFPLCTTAVKDRLAPLVDLNFAPTHTAEFWFTISTGGELP